MNPNLKAVLNFLSYAGIIGGVAGVQYLKVLYPSFDNTLVITLLIQTGTGLGYFHITSGSPKSSPTPPGDTQ